MDGPTTAARRFVRLSGRTVDLVRGVVVADGGQTCELTTRELALVDYLAANTGRDIPRDELLTQVWAWSERVSSRATDNAVRRLRTKIEDDPEHPRHLITARGAGYRFVVGDAPPIEAQAPTRAAVVALRGCVVDLDRQCVVRGTEVVALSRRETVLLTALLSADGGVVPRSALEREAWGSVVVPERALDQAIGRLRQKLATAEQLETVRELGYRLAVAGDAGGPPAELDHFFGRDAELARLAERLETPGLTTVKGPGGAGKTRLAVRAARDFERRTGLRVRFCRLADARDGAELVQVVARALGSAVAPGVDAIDLVGRSIGASGPTLVVLDNVEQLADQAATIDRWRGLAPSARWLVTSRERLAVAGEQVVELGGLSEGEAVALLVHRAAERDVDVSDAAALAPLANAVDRLPLALELAAARFGTLSPAEVLERISHDVGVLSRSPRGGSDRHGSLAVCIDWSVALLSREHREALGALASFEGPFDGAAAAAVLGDGGTSALDALVDRSLVQARGASDTGRGARFALLATVRTHVADTVPRTPAHARRFRAYYAGFGAGLRPAGATRDEVERWVVDLPNLVHACRDAIAEADSDAAIGTLCAIMEVVEQRGPLALAGELVDAVFAGCVLTVGQRGVARRIRARVSHRVGAFAEARQQYHLALADLADAPVEVARIWVRLGTLEQQSRDRSAALVCFDEAERVLRAAGDPLVEAYLAAGRGLSWSERPVDPEAWPAARARAELYLREAAAAFRQFGELGHHAMTQVYLGDLFLAEQDHERARVYYLDALEGLQDGGRDVNVASVLQNLGCVTDASAARAYTSAALALHRRVGRVRSAGLALRNLGHLELSEGDPAAAQVHFQEAVSCFANDPHNRGEVLGLLALAHARQGRAGRAWCLFDEAEALLLAHTSPSLAWVSKLRAEGAVPGQ